MMLRKSCCILVMLILIIAIITGCAGEYKNPFRLHVVANSNTAADQAVKLKVRDAILKLTALDMANIRDIDTAKEYIARNIGIIENKANEILSKNGSQYGAKAYTGVFAFPKKTYGEVTYAAGDYDALKIVLGSGRGDNWWCVMFPPLCVLEIAEEPEEGWDSLDEQDVEYVSFFAELFDRLFK